MVEKRSHKPNMAHGEQTINNCPIWNVTNTLEIQKRSLYTEKFNV